MRAFLAWYLEQNLVKVITGIVFVAAGIIAGVLGAQALDSQQQSDLLNHLNEFIQGLPGLAVNPGQVLRLTLKNNFQALALIWFLGLTVIGIPLVLVILFGRGFVLGFSVAFFVQGKGLQGFALAAMGMIVPNLIYLPVLLVAGASAMAFSRGLISQPERGSNRLGRRIAVYSAGIILLSLAIIIGGLLEAYLIPIGVRGLLNWT